MSSLHAYILATATAAPSIHIGGLLGVGAETTMQTSQPNGNKHAFRKKEIQRNFRLRKVQHDISI